MALVLADRVQETTTTTGTGTLTLAGAVSGFQSFAAIGNSNTTYYTIVEQSGTNWEVGLGTYTSSGTTLSRTTVLASSNAGSLVNFGAGTKNVFADYPAGKAIYLDASGNVIGLGTVTSGTWQATAVGAAYGGTGATSLTLNNVILGNGTSAVQFVAPGTSGNVLTSNGTTWQSTAPAASGATVTPTTANTTYYVVGSSTTSGTQTVASISNTNVVSYNASTGALSAVSHVSSSDESLKTNWRDVNPDFIERMAEVKHGVFDRIESGNTEVGVTAQSLLNALEQAVITDENGNLSVNYGGAALVACVQLCKRVLELEAKLDQLSKGNT